MKKLFIILLIILSLAFPINAIGANYYFDLSGGDDTTGDGSSGNPWKTIDKCTTSRTGGDECRGAKTTVTAISGTCTFTNGSNEIATSVDQSGTVSAGDFVSKNSGLEGWWLVASVDSDSINLTYEYWGLSGSGTPTTGYFVTPVSATEEYDFQASGTSAASRLKVSGGWDLTGPTQDGITAVTSTYNGIDTNLKNYVELSKFIFYTSGSQVINVNQTIEGYFHDLYLMNGSLAGIYLLTSPPQGTYENISMTGGTGDGLYGLTNRTTFTNVYAFSVGTGSGDAGFDTGGVGNIFNNIRAYNSYHYNFNLLTESFFNLFVSPVFDNVNYAFGRALGFSGNTGENRFFTPYLDGTGGDYTIYAASGFVANNIFIDATINADGGTGRVALVASYQTAIIPAVILNESGSDPIMYWNDGTIEWDSSGDCRSGKCLKFSPSSITYPLMYKVGSVKINQTASDITLSLYMKDDSSYNGETTLYVTRNGKFIQKSDITLTTSYVKQDEVVDTTDLVLNNYLDLWVWCNGSAGNMYVDDFSASP